MNEKTSNSLATFIVSNTRKNYSLELTCRHHRVRDDSYYDDDNNLAQFAKLVNSFPGQCFYDIYPDVKKSRQEKNPLRQLFVYAVYCCILSIVNGEDGCEKSKRIVRTMWEHLDKDHLANALMASRILRAISNRIRNNFDMVNKYRELKAYSDELQILAKDLLGECFKMKPYDSQKLLVRHLPGWGKKSTVLSLAYLGRQTYFLDQDCCRIQLNEIWYGNIDAFGEWKVTLTAKLFLCMIAPLPFIHILVPFDDRNTSESRKCEDHTDTKHVGACCEFFKKIRYFYTAPVIKFYWHTLSFIAFYTMFGIFLINDFKPYVPAVSKPNICECLVWAWALSMYSDGIAQVFTTNAPSFRLKFLKHFSSMWNVYDQLEFLALVISVVLRFTLPENTFQHARDAYAATFIMFILRFLRHFCVFEFFGTKLQIFVIMIKHTIFFCLICIVFLLAYGISSQGVLYPNSPLTWNLFGKMFRNSFYVFFGQIDTSATNDCVDSHSDSQCSYFAPVLYGFYAIVTYIMLINLLIATYSFTYEKNVAKAKRIWLYIEVNIITEYVEKSFLVPPLSIFVNISKVVCSIYRRCCCKKHTSRNRSRVWYAKDISQRLDQLEYDGMKELMNRNTEKRRHGKTRK